jgi:hypothetical protein
MLTAAAIGAGGYAAWRGGEAAVHAGGRKLEDIKRERRRNEHQRGLKAKARERSTRLSELQDRIQNAKQTSGEAVQTSTTTDATDERLQQERLNSIKDRYGEARQSQKKKKGGFFGRLTKGSSSKSGKK